MQQHRFLNTKSFRKWQFSLAVFFAAAIVYGATATRFLDVIVKNTLSVGSNSAANSKAALDVVSTTKGFLPPRMTTAQRAAISTPPEGLFVFDTDENFPNYYDGANWQSIASISGTETLTNKTLAAPTTDFLTFTHQTSPGASSAGEVLSYFKNDDKLYFTNSSGVEETYNPMTGVGDMIRGGTAGKATRIAACSDGQILKWASGVPACGSDTSGSTSYAYRSVTTTDSPTTSDYTLDLSGASFTVTLPTAVGHNNVFELIHSGTSLTQVYTLNTTSAQTIGGLASGVWKLSTNGERLKIQSTGANWIVLDHDAETAWVNYTPSLLNLGSISTNSMWWRRVGDSLQIQGYFVVGTVAAAKPCGFTIPANIDTAKIPGDQLNTLGTLFYNVSTTNTNLPDNTKGPFALTYDAASGANYLVFSHNLDTDDGLHAVNADNCSTLIANGTKQAVTTISIPIDTWQP